MNKISFFYYVIKMLILRFKTVLFISLLILFIASIGVKNLYFNADYQIFFDGENKQLQAFEEIQATFNKADNISIVIAPKSEDVFQKKYLTLIQDMTEDLWKTPYSSRVDSLSNYQHTEALGDNLLVEDLFYPHTPLTDEKIDKSKAIALSEPMLKNFILSDKGDVTVINITLQLPDIDETAEVKEVVGFISKLIEKYQARYPDVAFYQAGIVAMDYAFILSSQQDSETLIPAMLLVILLFLTLMLRSVTSVIATLLVIIFTISSTMGISGWLGMYISTATVNIPTLVMTLAVADCVHIIAMMNKRMLDGESKLDALIHSISVNFIPIFITSVTTAVGFLMMNMSDSPALRDLGNLAALGVMIACILSVTLLPALLMAFPIRVSIKSKNDKYSTQMESFAGFVVNHRGILLILSIFSIAICGFLATKNVINDDSIKYFSTNSQFRQSADFMEKHISGMTTINVSIKSNQSQGITEIKFMHMLDEFSSWLRLQPEVDHVSTLSDIYKRLNKNMHTDLEQYYSIPENKALAAQYLLLYEMSLPYGLDLSNQVNIDKSSVRVMATVDNLGSKELVDLEHRIYAWFEQNKYQYEILVASPSLMFAHIGETNMASMMKSLPISLIMISFLMIFTLRSFKLGLISFIPNIVPAIIGFGLWGVISGEINLGLSVVITLTLGIVVDDTVHFMMKYCHARHMGKNSEDSIKYAFNTVGRALWITSVVLVAGFFVLAFSDFRLNSDMGMLSGIIIIVAFIADFILLPTLLMFFDGEKSKKHESKSFIL